MSVAEERTESISLDLSREQLRVLHQALNEVLHGISDAELSTRMGAEREEIAALMDRIRKAHEQEGPVGP